MEKKYIIAILFVTVVFGEIIAAFLKEYSFVYDGYNRMQGGVIGVCVWKLIFNKKDKE